MRELEELLADYEGDAASLALTLERQRLAEWERALWRREWRQRGVEAWVWFLLALNGVILAVNLAAVRLWGGG